MRLLGRKTMIFGAHSALYSTAADADRRFFSEILGLKSVDAGRGWLIFALPPPETAFHPAEGGGTHELFFMCDDLKAEMATLAEKKVLLSEIREARWGVHTRNATPRRRAISASISHGTRWLWINPERGSSAKCVAATTIFREDFLSNGSFQVRFPAHAA
jgi:hypothetical protein